MITSELTQRDECYTAWMRQVERLCWQQRGCSAFELDRNWHLDYDRNLEPDEALEVAVRCSAS